MNDAAVRQRQQSEWLIQWKEFEDDASFLFAGWIYPATLDDFGGKTVLDAGCGGGQHLAQIAVHARKVVGVDLNTAEIARQRTARLQNVTVLEADIAEMDLGEQFDVVLSIGVIHHTDDPDKTVRNLKRHIKPGGKLILWVYAEEGNFLVQALLEPLKRSFLLRLTKPIVRLLAEVLTVTISLPVYSIYLLPLPFLPFYEYFQNWRRLSFRRNVLNVFDKLNAPQTAFIPREQVQRWMSPYEFREVHISCYQGISWRASGTKI